MLINNDNKIKETARILYNLHPQKYICKNDHAGIESFNYFPSKNLKIIKQQEKTGFELTQCAGTIHELYLRVIKFKNR